MSESSWSVTAVPVLHPAISRPDAAGALAFAAAAGLAAALAFPPPAAAATAVLAFLMALITLADLRHFLIPDPLSLPAIPLGLLANIAVFHGGDWGGGALESLLAAGAAGGAFLLLRALYARARGRQGLGLGDVKLAAAAGAWLGPDFLPVTVLAACLAALAGALVKRLLNGPGSVGARTLIPFGSFIAPAVFAFWVVRVTAGW